VSGSSFGNGAAAQSREEVNHSIDELIKRAPWAWFGYTSEARGAIAPERIARTTREVNARRMSATVQGAAASVREEARAESLDAERINAFRPIVPASRPYVPD
jgi:hypothetical protein